MGAISLSPVSCSDNTDSWFWAKTLAAWAGWRSASSAAVATCFCRSSAQARLATTLPRLITLGTPCVLYFSLRTKFAEMVPVIDLAPEFHVLIVIA